MDGQSLASLLGIMGLIGLCVGSFLNVVILRVPRYLFGQWQAQAIEFLTEEKPEYLTEQAATPLPHKHHWRSKCPHCHTSLGVLDLIPLFSFLWLKGRCRYCQGKIHWRYPVIETFTALMTIGLALHYPLGPKLFLMLGITWVLIAASSIDLDHKILPDEMTLGLMWLGLLVNLNGFFVPLKAAVIGAVAGYMSLWTLFWVFKLLRGKEGMGYGDFKLFAAFGALGGHEILLTTILVASLSSLAVNVVGLLLKKLDKDSMVPFGPYLALGGWLCLLLGPDFKTWLAF